MSGAPKPKRSLRPIPPESPAARDEGPRLIPFSGPAFNRNSAVPPLPTDGYIALADKAIRIWSKKTKTGSR